MSAPRPKILVVEDEPSIMELLRSALSAEGCSVVESTTAARGEIDAGNHKPDVAIIDLGLPDRDGVALIRSIRSWSSLPIVVVSARMMERSKIDALDAGADDYLTKPFGMGELLARVRVALRHAARPAGGEQVLKFGDAAVDLVQRRAWRSAKEVHLTPLEFRILSCLARHLGMVVTHRQLLTEVWGPPHATQTQYLRIYMKQLRRKLETYLLRPRHLLTETGVGYRLVSDEN